MEAEALGSPGPSPRTCDSPVLDAAPKGGLLSRLGESLLSTVTQSVRDSTQQVALSSQADLEQPLLPGDNEEEAHYIQHVMEPKQWPQLRLSSISTRRLTPGQLDGTPSAASSQLSGSGDNWLSPRAPGISSTLAAPFAPIPEAEPFLPKDGEQEAAGGATAAGGAASGAMPAVSPAGGKPGPQAGRYTRAAVAGCINAVIALPLQLSFAAIIFRDPFFKPMLGSLVKLVFLSSALHQMAFAAFSSMPCAVGQVQDVGLIFLSAIASAIVQQCTTAGLTTENTLATVLAAVTAATGIAGILIIGTGALKLAGLVQYVPLPVVGGYLCFVGYFCLTAGVSLASGVQVSELPSWLGLANADALIKLAPALLMVLLISLVLHRVRSPFALPALLVAAPLIFYGVLYATGTSLEEAREMGWVSKPNPGDGAWRFWHAWGLYNIHDFPPSNIYWDALPSQLGKLLALYFVVAFGSSMDIAAIQADTPRDLNYNSELVTVGLSNLFTACAGVGYTGSYIFSQTLFGVRMGVDTPLMGAIVAVAELAVFMVPFNVMTFLPNFYFGGLTAWIGQDILKDWLFIAFKRVSGVEYALLLSTFGLVMAVGLEAGIAAGILLAALHFAYSYSKVTMTAFTVVPSRSNAVRTFDQRTVLDMFAGRITAVSLSGYLFFGSSVTVVDRVVGIAASTLDTQPHLGPAAGDPQQLQQGGAGGGGSRMERLPSSNTLRQTYDNVAAFLDSKLGPGAAAQVAKVAAALAESPRFLILDFRRVQGLDATAARSFVTLHNKLQRMGIQLIITHIPARRANVRQLLAAQGLILKQPISAADWQQDTGAVCHWFPTMDGGCQFCEERFLEVAVAHGLCPPQARSLSLAQVLQAHLDLPRCILGYESPDYRASAAMLQRFTRKQELQVGDVLFALGSPADDIYLLESGTVSAHVDFALATVHSRSFAAAQQQLAASQGNFQAAPVQHAERIFKYGPGSIVGELDFFLQRPRTFEAVVESAGSAWRISRNAFEAMAAQDPASLVLLQTIILRSTCLSAAHAQEALERSTSSD